MKKERTPEGDIEGDKQCNFIKVEGRVVQKTMAELGLTDTQKFVQDYAATLRDIILGDEELKKAAEANEPGADEKIKDELIKRIKEQVV